MILGLQMKRLLARCCLPALRTTQTSREQGKQRLAMTFLFEYAFTSYCCKWFVYQTGLNQEIDLALAGHYCLAPQNAQEETEFLSARLQRKMHSAVLVADCQDLESRL